MDPGQVHQHHDLQMQARHAPKDRTRLGHIRAVLVGLEHVERGIDVQTIPVLASN